MTLFSGFRYYIVCLVWLFFFLCFLTALIKFIIWNLVKALELKFFYRQEVAEESGCVWVQEVCSEKTRSSPIWLHIEENWENLGPWSYKKLSSVQFSSVQSLSRVQLCDPMNCSMPGLLVSQLPESTQTHVHWVGDAIQPSHPLLSSSPPALNLSQHQGLFLWVSSSHQVAKVLELQLQHQSFQWIFRTDFKSGQYMSIQILLLTHKDKGTGQKTNNILERVSYSSAWGLVSYITSSLLSNSSLLPPQLILLTFNFNCVYPLLKDSQSFS